MSFVISNNNIWKSEGAANSVLYKKKKKIKMLELFKFCMLGKQKGAV